MVSFSLHILSGRRRSEGARLRQEDQIGACSVHQSRWKAVSRVHFGCGGEGELIELGDSLALVIRGLVAEGKRGISVTLRILEGATWSHSQVELCHTKLH